MNARFSLYDALVSVAVPAENARAVVHALKQDVSVLKDDVADLKRRMTAVEVELIALRKDLHAVESRLTLRLGSMMFLGMGLLFAALKLT